MRMFLRSASGARGRCRLDDLADFERFALQLHLAVGETFDVQKRLDHARQPLGLLVDHFGNLLALFFAQVVAAHQFAGSLNGRERRAHFVRDEMDGLLVMMAFGFRPRSARRTTKC
jgi:hypothetical protein